jgi:hypothetical protein
MTSGHLTAGAIAIILIGLAPHAKAEIFDIGSTFTASGLNSAGSWSDTVTLQNGTTLVDGGAQSLTVSIVPEGLSEWLVFTYTAVPVGPLMSNTSDDWSTYETGLDAVEGSDFDGAFVEFLNAGGSAITPSSSIFGGYSVESNPVPGGAGIGLGGSFTDDQPAMVWPALGTYIYPFSYLDDTGINSADVDGYVEALEFTPLVSSAPEPSSMLLSSAILFAIAFIGRKQLARRLSSATREASYFSGLK